MLNRPVPKNSKLRSFGLIAIIVTGIILLPMGSNSIAGAGNTHEDSRVHSETNTIVPGVRVGDYKLGMSKDDVLKSLGKPKAIFHGGEKYNLDNLPKTYFMRFDDISFEIVDDSVQAIVVHSPFYKFTNGLGVGDSEQEFKQAFGLQFKFEEDQGKLYLTYKDEGLQFIIHKKNRTVMEFTVTKKISREHSKTNTIVPGVRVGDYTFSMSKDDVLKSLGKPKVIFHGGEKFTLDNLPRKYIMLFDDISFGIVDDSIKGIGVLSPLYKFANGLGVGDSEQKIKQAFGDDFRLKETKGKDFLTYKNKGLMFEIHKKNRTVMEISVAQKNARELVKSVKPYGDVRGKDLSKLDLSARKGLITTLSFNQKTVWPEQAKMPSGSKSPKNTY